jgi:hypothetical protein
MMGYLQEDDLKTAGKSLQGQKEGYNTHLMLFDSVQITGLYS